MNTTGSSPLFLLAALSSVLEEWNSKHAAVLRGWGELRHRGVLGEALQWLQPWGALPRLGLTPTPPMWTRSVICLWHCLDVSSESWMTQASWPFVPLSTQSWSTGMYWNSGENLWDYQAKKSISAYTENLTLPFPELLCQHLEWEKPISVDISVTLSRNTVWGGLKETGPGWAAHWTRKSNGRCQGSLAGGRERALQKNRDDTKQMRWTIYLQCPQYMGG